ncbi:MAG: guanylate kinase [Thermaerobacter sp.]|nr:guanylate kinase [Thermaerobacter sp.]
MEPILFILTGPSGVGKGSVMRRLLDRVERLSKVVTFTTRPPRDAERDGFDYHFVPVPAFLDMVHQGQLYEYEQVYRDHYYGSPLHLFVPGHDALVELDYKGHRKYRSRHADVVSIFLLPPSLDELERRIVARSQVQNLPNRISNATVQLRHAGEYDYVVVNDDLPACVDRVARIIEVERLRRDGRRRLREVMTPPGPTPT